MKALVAVLALLVAGCGAASGSDSTETTPTFPESDKIVRVVNLNAAMGYRAGKGDPAGTDATREDLMLLARDILGNGGDIANLQEMALPAARELRTILRELSGDEWQLNWAHAANSSFYPGKNRDESPTYENVSSGNAQLVRIGDGITSQRPITIDDVNDDQGVVLPSGGRSFMGAEITTAQGVFDVYNTHLSLARQNSDERRAADVRRIQEITESGTNPAVVTGDLNQTIGVPDPSRLTMAAIETYTRDLDYTDVAADLGPTIDQKHPDKDSRRIDYILVRGVGASDTVRFVSHESDHWGLAATIEVSLGA
ncbi:endonuclease/exonuclease/phosphatase family protein [Actinophytocola sp.]|uniref:endonuclease/exonuclease/phosphatase family protein n=1 Tax=Actinophytocola sp. TaxID=1872138 RepID=UPI002ED21544